MTKIKYISYLVALYTWAILSFASIVVGGIALMVFDKGWGFYPFVVGLAMSAGFVGWQFTEALAIAGGVNGTKK